MRSFFSGLGAMCLVAAASAASVQAASSQQADSRESGWRAYQGPALREVRVVSSRPPAKVSTTTAWRHFAETGRGEWEAIWDRDTGVPLRIHGAGLDAPGTVDDAARAEAVSRDVLSQHIALLAPGALPGDFELVSNQLFNGVRVVGFRQLHGGVPVLSGQVSFRFKHDRLLVMASEALPNVRLPNQVAGAKLSSVASVESAALGWMQATVSADAKPLGSVSAPRILPLIGAGGVRAPAFRLVRTLPVGSQRAPGLWDVYVDAITGEPVARHQRLMFGSGTLLYNAPLRWPGGTRSDLPAAYANLVVDGANLTTDDAGSFSWPDAEADVTANAVGPYARVLNDAGAPAQANAIGVPDGAQLIWDKRDIEFEDAQISAFVHANIAKSYVRSWNPGLAWLDQQMTMTVNIDGVCNAASDGDAVYFYRAGGGCGNTARLADVVYHEFGHSLHRQSIIPGVGSFDASMSEGAGDFLAATITGDSAMGRGFFDTDAPLREIDPVGSEAVYPDDLDADEHINGLIYGGAFWDLRKAMIAKLGNGPGVEATEALFYATLQRATDMPSSYVEVLVEDDDDGNLANGTPNYCEIQQAFAAHGLTGSGPTPFEGTPQLDGLTVSLTLSSDLPACGRTLDEVRVDWRDRETPATAGSVALGLDANIYSGVIPFLASNAVVQYQVLATFSDGEVIRFPDNEADPWYEQYVGAVTQLYCTDFESDPAADGWTHALLAGIDQPGADDWQWGMPMGTATNGDPDVAWSGTQVFGNDLGDAGFNGLYRPDIINRATSPAVDVTGYDTVRLQYRRWLNVEDGSYDHATIYANSDPVWSNLSSGVGGSGTVHHADREWRFHDVDISGQVSGNSVQVAFEIESDSALEKGGWTLDDLCIVGIATTPPDPQVFRSGFEAVFTRP